MPILTELGQSLIGDLKENDLQVVKAFMPVVIKLLKGKEIDSTDLKQLKKANYGVGKTFENLVGSLPILKGIGKVMAEIGKSSSTSICWGIGKKIGVP